MEKGSNNWVSYLQLFVLIYTIHCLNEYRLSVLKDVENKLAIMHTSLEKSKELFINEFEKTDIKLMESSEKLEESFNKTKILLKKLEISQMESFKNSEKVSELILKMVESQQKAAELQPPIIIIDDKSIILLIVTLTGLFLISVCTLWCAPKIILLITTQIAKLNFIVNGLVQVIPGSNSAKGTSFLTDLGIRINTEVIRGISNHTVTEILTQKTFTLEEYLIKVLVNNPHLTQEVLPVLTKSGVDISGLL
jgi:hypothetical protein